MVPVFFGRRTWTPTTSLSDLITLFLGQEEVHVETIQAMRPTTLVLDVLLEIQKKRGSSCWLSEHRNADAADLLLLLGRGEGVPNTFLKRRHLSRPPPLSRKTPSKKEIEGLCALFP